MLRLGESKGDLEIDAIKCNFRIQDVERAKQLQLKLRDRTYAAAGHDLKGLDFEEKLDKIQLLFSSSKIRKNAVSCNPKKLTIDEKDRLV